MTRKRQPRPLLQDANHNARATTQYMTMAGSPAGYSGTRGQFSSSSSSRSPPRIAAVEDDSDNDDPVANHSREQAILSEDALNHNGEDTVSFKRKQKQIVGSRFLSALSGAGSDSRHASPSPRSGTPNLNRPLGLNIINGGVDVFNNRDTKDAAPLDWYVEGPGRRVGYDDMTAIDWIFEYTKERQRLRILYSSASGLLGYAQKFLDASQVWVVLILTGLAAGICAAGIDVASDWLGDIKSGYCAVGDDGGRFYLNKYFCCYGYDGLSQCRDWVPWSLALNVTSVGGKWFVEYFFFIALSVSDFPGLEAPLTAFRFFLLLQQAY